MEKSFLQNEAGYRDGLKHQNGRNKGSLHSKDGQSYMTPSLYLCFFLAKFYKDIGMVSCSFVPLLCNERLFHLFPLFLKAYDNTAFSVTLMFMGML